MWQGPGVQGCGEVRSRVHVWHSWDISTPPCEKKKGKKFQVVTLRERNPEKKIHLAAAAAWTALLNKLFHFAQIFKVVFSIKDLRLQIQYFPSRFAGICRLQAETSRKALTPWPTPDSSLKLKFLDPLLYRDPHQNSGPSSFLPLTEICMWSSRK